MEAAQQAVAQRVGARVGRENQRFKNQKKERKIKIIGLVSDKEGEICSLFFITARDCPLSRLLFYQKCQGV